MRSGRLTRLYRHFFSVTPLISTGVTGTFSIRLAVRRGSHGGDAVDDIHALEHAAEDGVAEVVGREPAVIERRGCRRR